MTPTLRVSEGIVAVPTISSSNVVTTLVANAVSLMPGTVAVEVVDNPRVLYLHVLHLDPESLRREVRRFEELVIEALGSPEARERVDGTEPLSAPGEEKS